jgi:hypothetical protein
LRALHPVGWDPTTPVRRPAELTFRLKQEAANLCLWRFPPRLKRTPGPPSLPDASAVVARLRDTPFAAEVVRLADEVLHHRFSIFGQVLETGKEIRWRRDYAQDIETETAYFRRIPYMDRDRAGDHKYIWELNRHQHLVILGQAFCFTGNPAYLAEAEWQITSWLAANPFLRGINWTSALEAAFRAISWIWLDHLAASQLSPRFRRQFLTALYQHGRFLERNLSIYFSPNTHLLGEAVALHALGTLYPDFPRSRQWRARGAALVAEQMERQVLADGTHFEQSTYYHVYALDFFLWHTLLAETTAGYRAKLHRMAEYLEALLGRTGRIPLIGDDDGGRIFHPYGDREACVRTSLAACGVYFQHPEWIRALEDLAPQAAWWIGAPALDRAPGVPCRPSSRLFRDSGVAVMAEGQVQIVIKAGGFGPASAGHSHSDALSVVCRRGMQEILIDPGTFTYLDAGWRDRFRGSAAHNTVQIDGLNQAHPVGPFRWGRLPEVRILQWSSTTQQDCLAGECCYAGFRHRRRFLFRKPDVLVIIDQIEGPSGDHLVEQFWHAAEPDAFAAVVFSRSVEPLDGWRSQQFGSKVFAPVRRVIHCGPLPVTLAAAVSFGEIPETLALHNTELTVHFASGVLVVPLV